jgi:hypothetical protein
MPIVALCLWGSATLLTLILLAFLIVHRSYRKLPLFTLYLAVNLLQTLVGIFLYQSYGFLSQLTYQIVWTTQGIVVFSRALAAFEVCHKILGTYRGVWGLAARIAGLLGALVLFTALYFGKHGVQSVVVTFEIGMESSIATGLTALFVFARYYQVGYNFSYRLLGVGLGLLSCFKILNDLVFERLAHLHGNAWNYTSSIAFLFSLALWIWALRSPVEVEKVQHATDAAIMYDQVIPQVNRKLADLNEQLGKLWQAESSKP